MKCQTTCAKAIFGGRFLGTMTAVPRGTAVTGQLGQASLGKSRQVGWQAAILESRLLAAELRKSRQV